MLIHKMGWVFQKVLYPTLTWRKESNGQKCIFLTFDDGPIPDMTPSILDILNTFDAKATFFCVGDNVRKYPSIFERIQLEGHAIGNHTFNHLNGWNTKDAIYFENVALCTSIIEKHRLKKRNQKMLFRPPYGRITKSQIGQLSINYEIIMWEVLSGDFLSSLSPESCLNKSVMYSESGSIIVFHDNLKAKKNLDIVLPKYLEHFSKLGYVFKSLEEGVKK